MKGLEYLFKAIEKCETKEIACKIIIADQKWGCAKTLVNAIKEDDI